MKSYEQNTGQELRIFILPADVTKFKPSKKVHILSYCVGE